MLRMNEINYINDPKYLTIVFMLYNRRSIPMNFGLFLFHNALIVSKFETFTQIRRSSFEGEKQVRVLASVCPCVYLSVLHYVCTWRSYGRTPRPIFMTWKYLVQRPCAILTLVKEFLIYFCFKLVNVYFKICDCFGRLVFKRRDVMVGIAKL